VYVIQACHGFDLTAQQLEGAVIYFDGGVGWLRSYSESIVFAGIKKELQEMGITIPKLMGLATNSAPAVIVMEGQNPKIFQKISKELPLKVVIRLTNVATMKSHVLTEATERSRNE